MPQNTRESGSIAPIVAHDVVLVSSSLPVGAVGSAKLGLPPKDSPTKGLATCNAAPHATAPSVPAGSYEQVLNCR
jgi:hypothetical protein